jgi:four helix bundle protein
MSYKGFEDLEIWKKGRTLRNEVRILCENFPANEKFKLTDQMIRASRSVTANIAEGSGRYHYQEYIQYCRAARGSVSEMQDHLTVALDEGYSDKSVFKNFWNEYKTLQKMINSFITYLRKRKQES